MTFCNITVLFLVNTELALPLIHNTSGGGLPVTWQTSDKSLPSTTGLIDLIKTSGESEERKKDVSYNYYASSK